MAQGDGQGLQALDERDGLARIRAGEQLPSAMVAPEDGEVIWIVDHAALG